MTDSAIEEREIWIDWAKHIPEFKEIMSLELFCGIPEGEFMSPIYFGEDRILLNRMKTNTKMFIPFPAELKKHIPHLVGKGWVKLWKYGIDNFTKKHFKIRKAIGLERMTPHYFKHVFVTMAAELGFSLKTISEITGTTIPTLQKVYLHSTDKDKIDLMDKLSERMMA